MTYCHISSSLYDSWQAMLRFFSLFAKFISHCNFFTSLLNDTDQGTPSKFSHELPQKVKNHSITQILLNYLLVLPIFGILMHFGDTKLFKKRFFSKVLVFHNRSTLFLQSSKEHKSAKDNLSDRRYVLGNVHTVELIRKMEKSGCTAHFLIFADKKCANFVDKSTALDSKL